MLNFAFKHAKEQHHLSLLPETFSDPFYNLHFKHWCMTPTPPNKINVLLLYNLRNTNCQGHGVFMIISAFWKKPCSFCGCHWFLLERLQKLLQKRQSFAGNSCICTKGSPGSADESFWLYRALVWGSQVATDYNLLCRLVFTCPVTFPNEIETSWLSRNKFTTTDNTHSWMSGTSVQLETDLQKNWNSLGWDPPTSCGNSCFTSFFL